MFRTFSGRKNQSLHSSFLRLSDFISFFSNCIQVYVCVCVCICVYFCATSQHIILALQNQRKSLPAQHLDENRSKEQRHFFCFPLLSVQTTLLHMHGYNAFDTKPHQLNQSYPCERVQMFQFFFSVYLQMGDAERWQMLSARRLKHECELIWIDVIPEEINAFF